MTQKTIKRELATLQEKGILTREGGRKEGKWVIIVIRVSQVCPKLSQARIHINGRRERTYVLRK